MVKFAQRMNYMEETANIVKNLFGAMNDPDMISFGGGAPAKEGLPVETLRDIFQEVMKRDGRGVEMLQYGKVQGVQDLRTVVAEALLAPKGMKATADDVLIVNGGLETMNLVCQVFIDPGDVILVESPTFVHCTEIFEMFQAKCIGMECDDQGILIDDVERKIKQYQPKMIYVIPTFQNPTGKTLPEDRRKKLAELGSAYDVMILEDDPYRELRYSGQDLRPIKYYDTTGHTIYANSFSKIFSPGSRVGFVYAAPEIMAKMIDAKSATNSHTNNVTQVLCAEFFKRGYFPQHLKNIITIHKERRDAMMHAIETYFPKNTKYVFPDGGLFTWVQLPGSIDTTALLKEAVAHKVAYVAGAGFFVEGDGRGRNCMRLSFGNVTSENIDIGIKRLGDLVKSHM